MIYLLPRKRQSNPLLRIALFFSGIVLVLLVIIRFFVPHFFPAVAVAVGRPVWSSGAESSNAIADFFNLLRSKRELILENRSLKTTIAEDALKLSTLTMLQNENTQLKALAGRSSEPGVVAAVLARPNVSPYDTLIVDAGTPEGVQVGDRVVVADDIVIGTINQVVGDTSIVQLFSSPGEKTTVQVGSHGVQTTATGKGGGNFEAQLPREVTAAVGDPVVMPSINPKLFGVIEDIAVTPSDPFQMIYFQNPVNLYEIQFVQIRRK